MPFRYWALPPRATADGGTDRGGTLEQGSINVFINGKPVARVGDLTSGCRVSRRAAPERAEAPCTGSRVMCSVSRFVLRLWLARAIAVLARDGSAIAQHSSQELETLRMLSQAHWRVRDYAGAMLDLIARGEPPSLLGRAEVTPYFSRLSMG